MLKALVCKDVSHLRGNLNKTLLSLECLSGNSSANWMMVFRSASFLGVNSRRPFPTSLAAVQLAALFNAWPIVSKKQN